MNRKAGSSVTVYGEIVSELRTTSAVDGVAVSYYMVRIRGQAKPIAVLSDDIRDIAAAKYVITDVDFLATRTAVAKAIRSHRKDANLSQRKLAELVGVTQNAVANWEIGRAVPRFYMVPILVKALGITIEELYADVGVQE